MCPSVAAWSTASVPVVQTEGSVGADYSQIELHAGDGGSLQVAEIGLVSRLDPDYAILTVARHDGDLRTTVTVHDEPPPVDPAWDCVAEFSWRSGISPQVTG